jgi:hypothetical protein
MQRIEKVVFLGLVSALFLTGCPEKGTGKEAPAAIPEEPAAPSDQAGAEEEKKEEKAEEKKDEAAEEGGW